MNIDPTPSDGDFESLLAEGEAALAAGNAPELSSVPAEIQPRLEQCLGWVRYLRDRGQERRGSSNEQPSGAPPQSRPAQIGRFEIVRELGRGGFGVVFLAWDPVLEREVALKVPRPEALITAETRARFFREARAAAGLDHPHIVPVHDAGEAGPICYIASAYCPGVTLAGWLKQQSEPVPFARAATLVTQLADAVDYAHRRGVVHRDLKPLNILLAGVRGQEPGASKDNLTPDSSILTPKVTDFGLAKLISPEGPDLTRSEALLGTPSYMAPEQASGRNTQVGPAADVYALGTVLYELLTGRPPFRGESDVDTLVQVRTTEPVAPARLRPKTPRDLETICLKCLEKDPRKRFASAGDLKADLDRYLRGEPIRAWPVGRVARLGRWCRRKPLVAGLSTALVGAVTAGVISTLVLWLLAEHRADVARAKRDEADRSFRRGLGAVNEFLNRIPQEELANAQGMQPLQRELLEAALQFYEEFLAERGDDPTLGAEVARAYHRVGRINELLGAHEQALAAYRAAGARYEALARDHPDDRDFLRNVAVSEEKTGVLLNGMRRADEAEESFRRASVVLSPLIASDPPDRAALHTHARVLLAQGVARSNRGRNEDALRLYAQAREVLEELCRGAPATEPLESLANVYENIAKVHQQGHEDRQALTGLENVVRIRRELVDRSPRGSGPRHRLAHTHLALALVLRKVQESTRTAAAYAQARDLLEPLVREYPQVVGIALDLARTYNSLGVLERSNRRGKEAIRLHERADEILQRLVQQHPDNLDVRTELGGNLHNLALVLCDFRRWEDALALYQQAIRHQAFALERDRERALSRQYLGNHLDSKGRLLCHLKRPAEAALAFLDCARLEPDQPQRQYQAALGLILAARAAEGRNTDRSAAEIETQKYLNEAVELLRRAVAKGYKNVEKLKQDASLDCLRGRDDFQRLIAELDVRR